jgi:hypothetical protein
MSAHHLLLAKTLYFYAILDTEISDDILLTYFQHEQLLSHTFAGLLKDVRLCV